MRTDLLNDIDRSEVESALINNNYRIDDCDAVVEVLKTKGNACKMVGLKYNKELKNYYEAPHCNLQQIQQYQESKNKKRRNKNYE